MFRYHGSVGHTAQSVGNYGEDDFNTAKRILKYEMTQ